MTTTRLLLAGVVLALIVGCNPLDPSKIAKPEDGGAGCSPACAATHVCLAQSGGGCACFETCDNGLCTEGSCVVDPTQGAVCVDLAQVKCE